jgi:serine/threonine-protein kinase
VTIFSEATILAALPSHVRLAAAWRILTAIEASDEFAEALNFAVRQGFVDADFAPQLLGDPDATAPNRYWVNPIDGSEMVWIPPGPFMIGQEQRRVDAHGFFLARYPITNAQFDRYLAAYRDPQVEEMLRTRGILNQPPDRARHPVTQVSYLDALGYCHWAGMTLPSEWLWEKAARGTDARTYPWGEQTPYSIEWSRQGNRMIETTKRLAQIRESDTCPVDKFAEIRSPYGCEQLAGNVSEWCEPDDEFFWMTGETTVPQRMPARTSDLEQAAVRGSCFKRRSLSRMASSHRRRLSVTRRNDWVGFRPAFYPPLHRVVRSPSG